MKKQLKKLSLSKETLRNLSGHEMQGVGGGATMSCCNSSGETGDTCYGCNVSSRCTSYC